MQAIFAPDDSMDNAVVSKRTSDTAQEPGGIAVGVEVDDRPPWRHA